MFKLMFLSVLGSLIVGSNAGVASFIKPCKINDKPCILTSAQAAIPHIAGGLPDLKVPVMDPLVLDNVNADDGELKLGFTDLKVTGAKNCKFVNIEFITDSTLIFDTECPIVAAGKYNVAGKLLVAPIEGDGDVIITIEKIKLSVKAELERVDGADGKKHVHIKSLEKSYEPVGKVHFQLDNLYHGDEAKAKPVRDILNASWKELINGIGRPIIYQIIDKAADGIEQFFVAVPIDELVQ